MRAARVCSPVLCMARLADDRCDFGVRLAPVETIAPVPKEGKPPHLADDRLRAYHRVFRIRVIHGIYTNSLSDHRLCSGDSGPSQNSVFLACEAQAAT